MIKLCFFSSFVVYSDLCLVDVLICIRIRHLVLDKIHFLQSRISVSQQKKNKFTRQMKSLFTTTKQKTTTKQPTSMNKCDTSRSVRQIISCPKAQLQHLINVEYLSLRLNIPCYNRLITLKLNIPITTIFKNFFPPLSLSSILDSFFFLQILKNLIYDLLTV